MGRRLLVAFMWSAPALLFYELGWSLFGFPRLVGPILAIGIAAFIVVDPLKVLWPKPARRILKADSFQTPAPTGPPIKAPR